ncbi:MAG: hypothetical protein AAGB14_00380 [Verrucomicrobiota bacterium]
MLRAFVAVVFLSLVACRKETVSVEYGETLKSEDGLSYKQTKEIVTHLIDPAKLDTLKGKRAANRRLRLICYHLQMADRAGFPPEHVMFAAHKSLGVEGKYRSEAVRHSIHRNLLILDRLGCLDEAGMAKLKTGNAPTITKGPYAGQIASVDHIIPRSIVEELDEKLYNLEFMPLELNQAKGNKVTLRQKQLAEKWHEQGLLSQEGLKAVMREAGGASPGR